MLTIYRNILVSLSITLIILILFVITNKIKKGFILHNFGILTFIIWMCIVYDLTGVTPLSGFHTDIRVQDISILPIYGIVTMISETMSAGIEENMVGSAIFYLFANICGNIILFMPIGFLSPLLFDKYRNLKKIIMTGLLTSLLIEVSQLFLSRGTDVDDLILNTTGCLLGYGCYKIMKKIMPRLSDKFTMQKEHRNLVFNPNYLLCIMLPYLIYVILGFVDRYYYFKA